MSVGVEAFSLRDPERPRQRAIRDGAPVALDVEPKLLELGQPRPRPKAPGRLTELPVVVGEEEIGLALSKTTTFS